MKITANERRVAGITMGRKAKKPTARDREIAASNGIKRYALETRLQRHWTMERAITEPIRKKRVSRGCAKAAAEKHGVVRQSIYKWRRANPKEADGMTFDEIAEQVAINKRRRGRKTSRIWTTSEISHLIKRLSEGATYHEIAEELGRWASQCRSQAYHLRKAGEP